MTEDSIREPITADVGEADISYIPDSDEVTIENVKDPDMEGYISISMPREELLRALDWMVWAGMGARYRHDNGQDRIVMFGVIQGKKGRTI